MDDSNSDSGASMEVNQQDSMSGGTGAGSVEASTKEPLLAQISFLILWGLLAGTVGAILLLSVVLGDVREPVLKVVLAGILSVVPGWLYVMFIRNKGKSLYDEYVLNLYRLQIDDVKNLPMPPQHTTYFQEWDREHEKIRKYLQKWERREARRDPERKPWAPTKDNLYRKKFEAIYGKNAVSTFSAIHDRYRLSYSAETISPVLFATMMFALGWVLVLPPDPFGLRMLPEVSGSGLPEALPFQALAFGFLGAYCYTLQDLIRRYFRDDLKAGAYISSVVRIVFVALVITAGTVVWGAVNDGENKILTEGAKALAFTIGFFPQIGLQLIFEAAQKRLGKKFPSLNARYPLGEIDGLNVWYQARLAEEGIEDAQNLVSANLVDLLLRTRAPVARLVDWLDQAFLQIHLAETTESEQESESGTQTLKRLRAMGIRTATELERAWTELGDEEAFVKRLSEALQLDPDLAASVVKSILTALKGEVNLWHIKQFRSHPWLREEAAAQETESRHVAVAPPVQSPVWAPSTLPGPARVPVAVGAEAR
jgi:hypothetical protein